MVRTRRLSRKGPSPNSTESEDRFTGRNFSCFRIADDDGNHHAFRLGNDVTILPHGHVPGQPIEEWEYWVGRVMQICAPIDANAKEAEDVRAEVQWYYNAKDTSDTIKSFKASAVGKFERIFSETKDFVDVRAFNAIVPLIIFHEEDHLAPYIPWDTFYCRYAFEKKMRAIQPKQSTTACNCHEPYNPNDTSPSSLMHFCPTPGCRHAYHQRCLFKTMLDDLPPALLLATSPFEDKGLDSDLGGPLRKRRRSGRLSSQGTTPVKLEEAKLESLNEALAGLPKMLVEIAKQPMVRGGAFQEGGVSGNIGFVTRARGIVYDFLESGTFPEKWEDEVFKPAKPEFPVGTIKNAIVRIAGSSKPNLPRLACPKCLSAI